MADEVPVCDVLCEAMEYLSKLGSNLRARSENLKEKRIRKDKLKNYHAVQKAADKVLLICQLSKKSLENVECGVRKVLTLMGANQGLDTAADPETPSSTSAVQDTDNYRYFKYRSYKLKVARKVPLKHFMSARVLARNMPMSMHDNYPVYHNCKLYRARKKRDREVLLKSTGNNESANIEKSDDKLESNKTDVNCELNMDTCTLESQELPMEESFGNVKKSKIDNSTSRKMSVSSNTSEKALQNIEDEKNNPHQDSDGLEDVKKSRSPKKLNNKHKNRLSLSRRISKGSDSEDYSKRRRSSKSHYKKIQVIDDDSSDNNNDPQDKITELCEKTSGIGESVQVIESKISDTNNKVSLDTPDSPSKMHETKENKCGDSDVEKDSVKSEDIDKIEEPSVKSGDSTKSEEETSTDAPIKPLIKCVSIDKLLKPDIVEKKVESPKKKSRSKKSRSSDDENTLRNKENVKHIIRKKKEASNCDEEEFWAHKRKEVSAFVSKKFVINVTRLPELTESFLQLHNLKKIVQNNQIVCELLSMKESINENKADKENNVNAKVDPINVVKNALLNDSDSEKSDGSGSKSPLPLTEIEKTIQNVLSNDKAPVMNLSLFDELNKTIDKVLKDTGISNDASNVDNPDTSPVSNVVSNHGDKVKDALLNDSDSEIDKGTEKTNNGNENNQENPHKDTELKKSLLAESDSENLELTKSQSTNDGDPKLNENEISVDRSVVTEQESAPGTEPQEDEDIEKNFHTELSPSHDPALNKSDDNLETPSKKKKHKRKNMMESIHAKKMLLTYSSSSDTEDEQLRNTLKELKDSLLKGMSSSDDEKKNNEDKKPFSSEDEEDIDLEKVRRKRKRKNLSSNENSDNGSKSSSVNPKNDSDQASCQSNKRRLKCDEQSISSSKKVRFQ